jgi:hypothetical protein
MAVRCLEAVWNRREGRDIATETNGGTNGSPQRLETSSQRSLTVVAGLCGCVCARAGAHLRPSRGLVLRPTPTQTLPPGQTARRTGLFGASEHYTRYIDGPHLLDGPHLIKLQLSMMELLCNGGGSKQCHITGSPTDSRTIPSARSPAPLAHWTKAVALAYLRPDICGDRFAAAAAPAARIVERSIDRSFIVRSLVVAATTQGSVAWQRAAA